MPKRWKCNGKLTEIRKYDESQGYKRTLIFRFYESVTYLDVRYGSNDAVTIKDNDSILKISQVYTGSSMDGPQIKGFWYLNTPLHHPKQVQLSKCRWQGSIKNIIKKVTVLDDFLVFQSTLDKSDLYWTHNYDNQNNMLLPTLKQQNKIRNQNIGLSKQNKQNNSGIINNNIIVKKHNEKQNNVNELKTENDNNNKVKQNTILKQQNKQHKSEIKNSIKPLPINEPKKKTKLLKNNENKDNMEESKTENLVINNNSNNIKKYKVNQNIKAKQKNKTGILQITKIYKNKPYIKGLWYKHYNDVHKEHNKFSQELILDPIDEGKIECDNIIDKVKIFDNIIDYALETSQHMKSTTLELYWCGNNKKRKREAKFSANKLKNKKKSKIMKTKLKMKGFNFEAECEKFIYKEATQQLLKAFIMVKNVNVLVLNIWNNKTQMQTLMDKFCKECNIHNDMKNIIDFKLRFTQKNDKCNKFITLKVDISDTDVDICKQEIALLCNAIYLFKNIDENIVIKYFGKNAQMILLPTQKKLIHKIKFEI